MTLEKFDYDALAFKGSCRYNTGKAQVVGIPNDKTRKTTSGRQSYRYNACRVRIMMIH